jgi:hypothetical protein
MGSQGVDFVGSCGLLGDDDVWVLDGGGGFLWLGGAGGVGGVGDGVFS